MPFNSEANMSPRLQIADLLADAKNLALIRLLRDRPRLAVSELARRVKMSAPAVRERLQRLEEAGILGWRVAVDPSALGFPVCCFVLKVHIAAIDQLDHVLDQFLSYGQTTTSLVQSTPVAPRLLPLPDERG